MAKISWSNSAISTAVQCKRKYKYVYIDKLQPEEDNTDLAFGQAMHTAIETILVDKEDGREIFSIYWDTYKDLPMSSPRFNWTKLKDLGLEFLRKFQRLHAKKYVITQMEQRLYGEYGGITLNGMPDFIGTYNGTLSLRDFKTSAYNYAKEKADITTQLYLYAYLMGQNLGYYPATLGYDVFVKSTGSIQNLTWNFDEDRMKEILDTMIVICKDMEEETLYPRNPYNCIMGAKICPFYKKCWEKEYE